MFLFFVIVFITAVIILLVLEYEKREKFSECKLFEENLRMKWQGEQIPCSNLESLSCADLAMLEKLCYDKEDSFHRKSCLEHVQPIIIKKCVIK